MRLKSKPILVKIVLQILCVFSFSSSPVIAIEGDSQAASEAQRTGIVGISYEDGFDNCIGVVLEPNKVLTTASCVELFSGPVTASSIRVHPLQGVELGGAISFPTLNEQVTPFIGVTDFSTHPLNTSRFGAFNLAVLSLEEPLDIGVAKIYSGSDFFLGRRADAFGWKEVTRRSDFLLRRFYEANTVELPPIVDGDNNVDSITDGCYDSFVDTDTVFCAGFRSETQFLESFDRGAPLFLNIGGNELVIGLLSFNSGGTEIDGQVDYEQYARVSKT